MALLVLRRVGLCVGQNQMCHLCGWLRISKYFVRWEKNKKHWVGQRVGLVAVQLEYVRYVGHLSKWFVFVNSFMFLVVCLLLDCRLLGLLITRLYTHILQSYLHTVCCICLYDTCSAKLKRDSLFPNEFCLMRGEK